MWIHADLNNILFLKNADKKMFFALSTISNNAVKQNL